MQSHSFFLNVYRPTLCHLLLYFSSAYFQTKSELIIAIKQLPHIQRESFVRSWGLWSHNLEDSKLHMAPFNEH